MFCVEGVWESRVLFGDLDVIESLSQFEAVHRSRAAAEARCLDTKALQKADIEIGERVVLLLVEGEVSGVFESSASEQDG